MPSKKQNRMEGKNYHLLSKNRRERKREPEETSSSRRKRNFKRSRKKRNRNKINSNRHPLEKIRLARVKRIKKGRMTFEQLEKISKELPRKIQNHSSLNWKKWKKWRDNNF